MTRSSAEQARLRPPPLQTPVHRQTGSTAPGSPTSPRPHTPPDSERFPEVEESAPATRSARPGHQNFVLTDPVAFRYLEEDPSTTVLDRRRKLTGYECYIVEQWTTSRTHPTFMITTYTGDPSSSVMVSVLSVPTDENLWSPRLRVYFKALNQYHAKRRESPFGILMVTNLSSFPSALTVIPVPDGDIRKHRFDFLVNEDLKRLGCSGRVGLNLSQPAAATVAKFHQLYRTDEKNDAYQSVLELIKLCQSALTIFDKLEIDYSDGLLCDVTEKAVTNWWLEFGGQYYNAEPHDGILGPSTVAGLLGLLMGARNRLHAINAPVPKDPFDVEGMKKGISSFQKQQHMPRTRRLDRKTLDRLHKSTQKAAEKDRWGVPKAVKSTMAELSGKGGEMVMDAVGRRDKAGIAEIETVDIDRFMQLVYGDRAKWLWLGKPNKKQKISDANEKVLEEVQGERSANQGLVFRSDEHGGFTWTTGRKSTVDGVVAGKREQQRQDREYENFNKASPMEEVEEGEDEAKPSMFKRATTIKDEAKSGFGKVRGAVGLGGHRSKPSTDETTQTSPTEQENGKSRRPLLFRALSSPISSPSSPRGQEKEDRMMPSVSERSKRLNVAINRNRSDTAESRSMIDASEATQVASPEHDSQSAPGIEPSSGRHEQQHNTDTEASGTATATASIAGSMYNGVDLNDALPAKPDTEIDTSHLLRRTTSYSRYVDVQLESHHDEAFPRNLSFSLAEDSISRWPTLSGDSSDSSYENLRAQYAAQQLRAKEAKHLRALIAAVHADTAAWTTSQIELLQTVLRQYDADQEAVDFLHEPHVQSLQELQAHSEGVLRAETERLGEGAKEIEMIAAKLEYEIDGLKSKIEDVQAGVGDFEKGVVRVEERVVELEKEGEREGWRCTLQ